MKKRTTKRALAMSFFAMLLCCAMLIGTTYAWFTDSATSGTNKIVAGNLDIELKVWDAEEEDFVDSTDALFGVDLWEPGVVAYETFKAENVGNLALKYDVTVNVIDKNTLNDHSLDEVIKVGVYAGEVGDMTRDELVEAVTFKSFDDTTARVAGTKLLPEASEVFTVVAYWEPTDHDNDYNVNNGQKTDDDGVELYIDFGVVVTATQAVHESDSFGNDYDATGIEAVTAAIVKGAADSNKALEDTTNGVVYFDDELRTEGDVIAITLHFEGEDSKDYIMAAFDAISELIVDAVDANAADIYSIEIGVGLPEKLETLGIEGVETNVRVLNGKPVVYEGEYESWLYEDLGKLLTKAVPSGTLTERMQACLEFTEKEGLDVEIIDMSGVAQTYRMYFDLGWVTSAIDNVTDAINQGAQDANSAIEDAIGEPGIIWFDEEGLQPNEKGELAITLHFGEGSMDYVNETYTAVKALIGKAVYEQRDTVVSFNIAGVGARNVAEATSAEEIENWVEEDLRTVMNSISGGLSGALQAAKAEGLPVEIITTDDASQTYRMNFEISENW